MKFNKKRLAMFGIPILSLVIVSAMLVGYLSYPVRTTVTIESPILMEISADGIIYGSDPLSPDTMYTGGVDPYTFWVKVTNQADVEVEGVIKNTVKNIGITCQDFESVIAGTTSWYLSADDVPQRVKDGCSPFDQAGLIWDCHEWDLMDNCVETEIEIGETGIFMDAIQFGYGPEPVTFAPGQIDLTRIVATFGPVEGTYFFSSQVVPAN